MVAVVWHRASRKRDALSTLLSPRDAVGALARIVVLPHSATGRRAVGQLGW